MWQDLLALLLLLAVGWGRLRGLRATVRRGLPQLGQALVNALYHPYYRLVLLTITLLAVGWVNTLAQFGWEGLAKQLAGQPPPPPAHETERCYEFQRMAAGESGLGDYKECPFKGELFVDSEGYVVCRRHGRAPNNPPVTRP